MAVEFLPSVHVTPKVEPRADRWWKGAVIYQIYPRSFQDSDGNGIGDLAGITRRLDHVASLGVDAIWISPFMKSPQKDFGYDVEDYRAVDPMFGTLDDFDAMLEAAHARDLKVLIDFVPSHTSDRHAWFKESRASRDNARADWYVWASPRPDGTAPNNWMSVFGGPAWAFDTRRHQYYLHNFLEEQPDLNFHNPDVIAALMEQAKFWLDRGVDGFRVDAIDFGVHDPQLRDNPARPPAPDQHGAITPFGMQYQQWNKARPELSELFLKPLYRLTQNYAGRCLLGEISGDHALRRMADYSHGGGLDMAYSFELLTCAPTASAIARVVEQAERHIGEGWPCFAFSNHDVYRSGTRFARGTPHPDLLALIPQLLCSLRGSICLYQGEELGLTETPLTYDQLQDPVGLTFWPESRGRDGCRTPMPWAAQAPHAGFSEADPWLPVGEANAARAVDRQEGDPASVLERTRAFLAWRRNRPALIRGDLQLMGDGEMVLTFVRSWEGETIFCAFNLTDQPQTVDLGAGLSNPVRSLDCPTAAGRVDGTTVHLPAYASLFAAPAADAKEP